MRRIVVVLSLALLAVVNAVDAQTQLPPGHPQTTPRQDVPGPPPGTGTGATGLTWTAPSHWVNEKPASSMRRAQYRINGKGGHADCVVFYFGPGQGGDAKANAQRWGNQFTKADGSPAGTLKTREIKVGDMPALLVEVTGTYVGGMGADTAPRPDAMLLGAIVDGPDARWFFRAVGPRTTLDSERGAFETMIRSIRRGTT